MKEKNDKNLFNQLVLYGGALLISGLYIMIYLFFLKELGERMYTVFYSLLNSFIAVPIFTTAFSALITLEIQRRWIKIIPAAMRKSALYSSLFLMIGFLLLIALYFGGVSYSYPVFLILMTPIPYIFIGVLLSIGVTKNSSQ